MTHPSGPIIDIHCHILPGIDDGARDAVESLEMARIAVRDEIVAVVTTPHHLPRSGLTAVEEAGKRVKDLQERLLWAEIDLRLHPGQEIAIQPDLPQLLQKGEAVPLNGTRYVLVEPPFISYPPYIDDLLFQVQLQGKVPILAHPERCAGIQRDPSILHRLVERGVLAQMNTGSLLGHYGNDAKEAAEVLLGRDLIHILASDAHHATGSRVPQVTEGVNAVAKLIGEERAWAMMTTNPQAVVEGGRIKVPEPLERPARRPGGVFSFIFRR